MSWSEVPFDAIIADSAFGPRFSGDCYSDDGNVATLRTTDLSPDGFISLDTMPHARIDEDKFEGHFLKVGDLVISRSGRIGTTALFDGYHKLVLPGAFLIRFRLDLSKAHPLFFRLFFNSNEGQQRLLSVAQGAAQQNINITNVRKLSVPLPPLAEQYRIASLLACYDDLITTNRRRIALLEDAARRLYREWFVHLRFPGHESVPVEDGVPEGWSLVAIGECFDFHIGGGWGKKYSESGSSEAAYVIRGTDLPRIRDGELGGVPLRFHPERNLASRRLEPGDLVFEVSGGSRDQGVGRLLNVTGQLLDQFDNPVMSASFCKLIRPNVHCES
jgi:type I restriction enzyme S subunit